MLRLEPKVRAGPVLALAKYLDAQKVDINSVAPLCGIDMSVLGDPMRMLPLKAVARLFAAASASTGNVRLPLALAEFAELGNSGLVGHLALSAPTVRGFLECLAGFSPILVSQYEVGYSEKGGTGRIYWRGASGFDVPMQSFSLYVAASVIRRIRAAAGPNWVPLSATLEHGIPVGTEREVARLFGPRLSLDSNCSSLTVDPATLSRPMPSANEELFAIYRHHGNLLLREITLEVDLVSRVRGAIENRLLNEVPSLEIVALDVGVTARSLQRRLENSGTSFERVLDETRYAVAERLLRETDQPLMAVAHASGYASQSTFTRAVRRWLDMPPRVYRQKFRGVAADRS
ncbi:MAG: AraC family transcriptional regulator ligand-binding domain-containing protein [Hyphomicrobiaceae bacterium]|nr:AraC family transcriptional regulator ligand-binding domain-containing protein [Hyphomicrobiaceae bacterium]